MEKTALAEVDERTGQFLRTASRYRSFVPSPRYPLEPGRYILYVSMACPWANRCMAVLFLKGLEKVIRVAITHPVWQRTRPHSKTDLHSGWVFRDPSDTTPVHNVDGFGSFTSEGCIPDPLGRVECIRDLYDEEQDKKFTVPVLFDSHTRTIVNNESSDIMRMMNNWNIPIEDVGRVATSLDLYPEDDRAEIDRLADFIYHSINDGVYKCGFAKTQEAYDTAVTSLFSALDECDAILSKQRWLAGTKNISEVDIKLFCTLIRFDPVYVVYFKTNCKLIEQYDNLREYVLDILSTYPEVRRSVDMTHIKTHYFGSHPTLNPYAIVPKGPQSEWWCDVDQISSRSVKLGRKAVAFEV
jgi:putative glutathione S-transferase